MDRLILAEKLESLRRSIQRVEDKKPAQLSRLIQDLDLQDILVLNLSRAVQLCVDVGTHVISESEEAAPQTMGEVFSNLHRLRAISAKTAEQMRKAVGFRNIAVHNYQAISWEIVFAICEHSLADFRRFAREIGKYVQL